MSPSKNAVISTGEGPDARDPVRRLARGTRAFLRGIGQVGGT